MRCRFPKLTDNNATDNICQTNGGQTKFATDVLEWVTWCKPISIIVPLVPSSNRFFLSSFFFFFLHFSCAFFLFCPFCCFVVFLCQRYRCVRHRRVCILRWSNAINLTTGFSYVCLWEREKQTLGDKVNIHGVLCPFSKELCV